MSVRRAATFREVFERMARRAHAYPPPELYEEVSFDEIEGSWRHFAEKDAHAPLGVYVHVPFCSRKCAFCYCDTVITDDARRMSAYVDALCREIDAFAPFVAARDVQTVYLGGGTPTYLPAPELHRLLAHLRGAFRWAEGAQLDLEGTPQSITPATAEVLRAFGAQRVTLGIQALSDDILVAQNRPQPFAAVATAFARLRDAGVEVVSVDLVGGLPDDRPDAVRAGLERLIDLGPDLVHVYPYSERPGVERNPEKGAILRAAEQTLLSRGYRPGRWDGWAHEGVLAHPHLANLQVVHKTALAGSCMGFGVRARSHVFNRLAYRSHLVRDYEASLAAGELPAYRGMMLSRRLQVERYLMDNLAAGVNRRRFRALFGGDVLEVLQVCYPEVVGMVAVTADEVRLEEAHRAGQGVNPHLFDDTLRARLYLQHIGQPAGWPTAEIQSAREPAPPDVNWNSFLALQLSKGNTYPPIDRSGRVTDGVVQEAWEDLAGRIRAGEALEAVGLYAHVPWCASICKFCYCYKQLLERPEVLDDYVDAVVAQLERVAPRLDGVRLNSIYFGGGTPSVLTPAQLDRLIGRIHDTLAFTDDHQFNFEGTPATLARDGRLATLARLGVHRLTIGIQSLDRDLLTDMNRAQAGASVVHRVIQEARDVGIRYINTDLLAGLPGQTLDHFKRTLDTLISWGPDVIHPYPFQPTAETVYYQEGFRVTPELEDRRAQMMQYAERALMAAGYRTVPMESWARSEAARNRQDVEKITHAASILPLGYNARGHVFGKLSYGVVDDDFRAFMQDRSKLDFYYGTELTLHDDMVRYLISNLRTGIDRIAYFDIFREDPLDRFWPQFLWLQRQGLVAVERARIRSRFRDSHDVTVHAKLFFDPVVHGELRARFEGRFDPGHNYVRDFEATYQRGF